MPKILVELGFISNRDEERFIASKEGQKKLAKGIFDGFSEYYSLYGKQQSSKSTKNIGKKVEKESKIDDTSKNRNDVHSGTPVFKIQIFATDKKLKKNDKRLKGVKADYYKEGNWYKYTYGECKDYNEILKKKKEISKKFSQAFIVAFIDGKKVNTNEAIRIYKEKKK